MKLVLRIESEGQSDPLFREFGPGVYRVGRSHLCDLVLEGREISRSHLEIRVTDSAVYITNMTASGRLKLNQERVETGELKDGDLLELGNYRLSIQLVLSESVSELNQSAEEQPEQGVEADVVAPVEDPIPDSPPVEPQVASEPSPPFAEVREFPLFERIQDESGEAVQGALALKQESTAVEQHSVVAKLLFVEGPRSGTEVPLQGYEMTLGRSKKADVFIDDDKLSRKHAKITRVGTGYRLIDLESRNGTYVNGIRVLEHPLSSFDIIELGRSKIKFLVMDLEMGISPLGGALEPLASIPETKSIQLVPEIEAKAPASQENPVSSSVSPATTPSRWAGLRSKRNLILTGVIGLLLLLLVVMPESEPKKGEEEEKNSSSVATQEPLKENPVDTNLVPQIPREFTDLSPQAQRKVEGHYNNASRYSEREDYENAFVEIKELHKVIPYYKESKKLEAFYLKKLKERQKAEAAEKATRDRYAELQIHLEEGVEYLQQGEFSKAEEAFNFAIVLDPQNDTAVKGLKAARLQIKDIENLPPEVDPEMEKRKLVSQLMEQAAFKFEEKSYQEAINLAEKVRTIELKGETEYLNQAKQLIDKARLQQKEEFEPFLIQAKEKFAEGDYNLSRDLCDEMLKKDPSYEAAQECSLRARKQLNRLAKEAYTHGYILESMNRLEEAKQYWNRAKNYARPGDPYYNKIQKKLDNYQ